MSKEFLDTLQERVWQNLQSSGLLELILSKSHHADNPSRYIGVKFWRELQPGGDRHYYMWIQIAIEHQHGSQPVTPKLYRITDSEQEQRDLCGQIWEGISIDDIVKVAAISAEEYHSGRKWMNPSQQIVMEKFYPAVNRGAVKVEIVPYSAQFRVSVQQ